MEKPTGNVVLNCSCKQACSGQLVVIPIKIDDQKRIDIQTLGIGGTVLSNEDRAVLAEILLDAEWFGA